MLTGCPRPRRMYPSTARCEESNERVCSSSGDIPGVGAGVGVVPFGCGIDEVRAGALVESTAAEE